MRRGTWIATVAGLSMATSVTTGSSASLAATGPGTMQVHDSKSCTGSGSESTVDIPFSLEFTGFDPLASGTVTISTQPGDVQVGTADVRVGPRGNRCVRVTGEAPDGSYKIVYDFGSGSGKQKVIRIESATASPSASPTVTAVPSASASATASPTATASASSSPSLSPTSTPTPSPTTSVGRLVLTALPLSPANVSAGTSGDDELAASGGGASSSVILAALASLALGACAVVATRRRRT